MLFSSSLDYMVDDVLMHIDGCVDTLKFINMVCGIDELSLNSG